VTAPQPPAEVWFVRDPGVATPDVIAVYPDEQAARQFAETLNQEYQLRKLFVERWEVPGLE
jgi:hypothetical protein